MAQLNFDLTTNNENKVLSKRCPKSAVMTLQVGLPGGKQLSDGVHTIGIIEPNVSVTKVSLVTRTAFDGTTPVVTITDTQNGTRETWFTNAGLTVESIEESLLTAPSLGGKVDPFYRGKNGPSVWEADILVGDSTVGEFVLLVDYVQLDVEPDKHS